LDSYVPEDKKWLLIKPHGSVNWAREIDNCPSDLTSGQRPTELEAEPRFSQNAEVKLVMWNKHHLQYFVPGSTTDGYLYPQIVIPADQPKEFACPLYHIERAKAFVQDCDNFILIGFSGHDDDVASLLEVMPIGSRLMIVGHGSQNAQQTFNNICSAATGLTLKSLRSSFYNHGFSKFVESEELRSLLADKSVRMTALSSGTG
jgi:hypothetical protein